MLSHLQRVAGAIGVLLTLTLSAVADPAYPAFTAPVVDAAGVLSSDDKAAITQKLLDLQTKSHIQFAVATIASLGGDEIEPYANALFRQWKLGEKDVNNGLLLVVAPKDHRLRFEVGYGLEGTMTDLQAKLIIANTMVPKLKTGDTTGAIKAGVDNAITVLTTDKASWPRELKPAARPADQGDTLTGTIFIVVFIAIVLIMMFRRRHRWSGGSGWSTGAGLGGGTLIDSDSSGGGDSFSGGGGGDSGGGGASGSW